MSRSLLRRAAVIASGCALGVVAVAAATPAALAAPTPSVRSSSVSPSTCGLGTLRGTYLYAGTGTTVSGGTVTPSAFAGSEVYTGTGQVSGSSTSSSGGTIRPRSPYTGTYTLNADCTGTLTIGTTLNFDIYVAPSGDTFTYIETDAGSVSAVTESRVAPG